MTEKLYIEQRYPCSAEILAKLLMDDDFDAEMLAAIDVKRETLEASDEGDVIRRRLRMTPPTKLPGFMKKLVKSNAYVEDREWNSATRLCTWSIDMSSAKIDIRGTLKVVPDGPDACKRINEGEVTIKIPLVGGKIEKFVIKQTEETFAKAVPFINDYLATNDLS